MLTKKPYGLFEVFGVELEYMLVSKQDLSVKPIVDELLKKAAGHYTNDYADEEMGWANELVMHVMEVRNNDPLPTLEGLGEKFSETLKKISSLAASMDAQLMPTAMHPWMNPALEAKIWPHEYHEIYNQFDQIFDCKRHGWANLQSCQLNLPFANDAEFEKLHAAIRVLLPIMPALASSSPFVEGKKTDFINNRLEVYKSNAYKTPLVAGSCIPEPIYTKEDYEKKLLPSLYDQIKPFDRHGTLQHEWLNARGAIARFDRNAIEIRILDIQEHPSVDIAICKVITAVLELLVNDHFSPIATLKQWDTLKLKAILDQNIRSADNAIITDQDYLSLWGIKEKKCSSNELWHYLAHEEISKTLQQDTLTFSIIDSLLKEGVLSRRIMKAVGTDITRDRLHSVYQELCKCLSEGKMFHV